MENRQIWLKPKPTHIDENFEDVLECMRVTKKEHEKRLLSYTEGEYVPVEVGKATQL